VNGNTILTDWLFWRSILLFRDIF